LVTHAPKLTKTEGRVDWTLPAPRIHNLVRGLWPWPHAYTYLDHTRYILHRSRLSAWPTLNEPPGTIVHATPIDGLHVVCGDRTTLELAEIQLEGKRVMSAREAMAAQTLGTGARFSLP
jgi:methionyl-tRNA formyltransferase